MVGKPDALTGKLHFLFSLELRDVFELLSIFWASRSDFCVPEERLHRERIHLENQHRLQLEQLREAHENFWNRWNTDRDFSARLRDSREMITSQMCTLAELQQLYRRKQEVELQTAEKQYRLQLHLLELRQIELEHSRWILREGLLRSRL